MSDSQEAEKYETQHPRLWNPHISQKQNLHKNMITKPIATKFAKWNVSPLETLQNSLVYQLRQKLNNGEKMNRTEKNWLAKNLFSNSYFSTSVPLMGYQFDFSDVIQKYLVNQYGHWCQYYAPDKTSLRETIDGQINQIIEVKP